MFLLGWEGVPTPLRQRRLIGEAVRKYRRRSGLSQERLAEKADLHPVYVGEVERVRDLVREL